MHIRTAEDRDIQIHRLLGYGEVAEGTAAPTYSTDEKLIEGEVLARYGPLRLVWGKRGRGEHRFHTLLVKEGRRKLFGTIMMNSRAECLCQALLHLYARDAKRRETPLLRTGFYWFRPEPEVPFFPYIWRSFGPAIMTHPTWFESADPFVVFVKVYGGGAWAIGTEHLGWPGLYPDGGDVPVRVDVLPGEFGPRIDPPAEWHADYDPESFEPLVGCYDDAARGEHHARGEGEE